MSVTSLATGLSVRDSYKSTTGLAVAASMASAKISNRVIGREGTR